MVAAVWSGSPLCLCAPSSIPDIPGFHVNWFPARLVSLGCLGTRYNASGEGTGLQVRINK